MGKYGSDARIEEFVINNLSRLAKTDRFSIEDFSFNSIFHDVSKKFDITEERLGKILEKLEESKVLVSKEKSMKIYVPIQYKKKLDYVDDRIDTYAFFVGSIIIGYILYPYIAPWLGSSSVNADFRNTNDLIGLIVSGFFLPWGMGAAVAYPLRYLFRLLYQENERFNEIIKMLGGRNRILFALSFALIPTISLVALGVYLDYAINLGILVSIFALFASIFIGLLQIKGTPN